MTQGEFEFGETKACRVCQEEKQLSSYYEYTPGGLNFTTCKPCMLKINNQVKRLNKGYKSLKPLHCECCGSYGIDTGLDHCHHTGSFRGFICQSCNTKLGMWGDTYESVVDKDLDPMYEEYLYRASLRNGSNKRIETGREKRGQYR